MWRCDGPWIRDGRGRIRILRGANVSGRCKSPPFVPFDDPATLDPLAAWGMDAIRLLVMWEALEPERGRIDELYLARVREIAVAAGARGLGVIIDFHQDLFARELGGDGAPSWAVTHRGKPARGRTWFYHYAHSAAVRRSLDAFWCDTDGIRTAYLASVRRVMTVMRDVDCVIGYDLFNEPMAGNRTVASGRFEREWLAEFYRAGIALRDEVDPDRLLFLEPTPLAAFGFPTALPSVAGRNLVFAPHIYDATAILVSRYMPAASTFPRSLRTLQDAAMRVGWPLFVGEFGVLSGIVGDAAMMEDQCRLLDRRFAGWTVWHYNPSDVDWNDEDASIVDPDGSERPWTGALVRPYPRALAGEPIAWDSDARRPWQLRYTASGEQTEIVVPSRWAAEGCTPEIRGGAWQWERDGTLLVVDADHGSPVEVLLHRGPS